MASTCLITLFLPLTCLEVEGVSFMMTGSICIVSSSILGSKVKGDIWLYLWMKNPQLYNLVFSSWEIPIF